MTLLMGVSDAALLPHALAHYRLTAPLIEASLAGTPIVYRNFPNPSAAGIFHVTATPLSTNALLHAIHRSYALEFYTWAPLPSDEDRLRFARILLQAPPGVAFDRVKLAALAVRAQLYEAARLEAIVLADGGTGIGLWIPLADAPRAEYVRAWLHTLVNRVAERHPDLVSTVPNTHHDGRVHLHVSSNARGRYSAVPYSLRAESMTVCTPVRWEELGSIEGANAFDAAAVADRIRKFGDVFSAEYAVIASQRLDSGSAVMPTPAPRGRIITAAIDILEDGNARTAEDLLSEAVKRKLVPTETKRKYIYSALIEYIARQLGRGRKPPIVQDAQRRFRINEPADDWPDLVSLPQPPERPDVTALCERLESTGSGEDPAAFETAVCDAFAHLGFLTKHLGDRAEPDGIADAILGPLGFRVTIECKTAKSIVTQPDAAEAAKFREPYGAQLSVLVGPAFGDETELLQELQTHAVTALTVPDLQTLLHLAANALEVKEILQPGYAGDVLGDLLWDRRHGRAKRVGDISALIQREGWKAQVTAAEEGGPANAPTLTVDSAMLLVDAALRDAGSTHACTREDVEASFAHLSSPLVAAAQMTGSSLVLVTPLP